MRLHAERVAASAHTVAKRIKLSEVRSIAPDGKLDVPHPILFKPVKLSCDEMRVMRAFSNLGYERLHKVLF